MIENIKKLYFGSTKQNIKEIRAGKFLTAFKSIASCFAINLEECYGELNKKYTSINWSFDQWQKSEAYLKKQEIPKLIKINTNAKEWIKTSGNSIGYLYEVNIDDYIKDNITIYEIYGAILECFGDNSNKINYHIVEELKNDPWKAIIKSKELLTKKEVELWHKYYTIDIDKKQIPYYFIIRNTLNNLEYVYYSDDNNWMPINTKEEVQKAKEVGLKKHLKEEQLDFTISNSNKKINPVLDTIRDSIREVIYKGKKNIPVKLIKTLYLNWTCEYSQANSNTHGFASIGAQKYDPPYSIEILKEKYPKLLEDPTHKWRAKTGIELIHKEPDFQEQKRIFYNWLIMPKKMQEESDKKSKSLFKLTNLEHHNAIMEYQWHDQNYFELNDIRMRYDKRDIEENGLKYIHISLKNTSLTMIPRIPKHAFQLKAKFKQHSENTTIPRICCSDSIFGAIAAIKINENATYYVHLLEPKKVMNNKEVMQYVPDAAATGECWILDNEIKSKVIGKIEIGSLLPYVYTFLKSDNFFRCCHYHDYTFYPYESLFNRTYRKIINNL